MRRCLSIQFLIGAMYATSSNGVAEVVPDVSDFVESIGKQAIETDKIVGLSIAVARRRNPRCQRFRSRQRRAECRGDG